MTETQTTTTKTTKPEVNKDANWAQINSIAPQTLCKKCGSKKLTDLNGEIFCPQKAKDCPFV